MANLETGSTWTAELVAEKFAPPTPEASHIMDLAKQLALFYLAQNLAQFIDGLLDDVLEAVQTAGLT